MRVDGSPLHDYHNAIVGTSCGTDANLRLKKVESFLSESRQPQWATIIRGDAWMTIAYAACIDPWSMIRKKAATAYADIISQHAFTPTAIALPLSKLLSHTVDTAHWYELEGALLLAKCMLTSETLRPMLVEDWERVTVPLLQGLLKPCLGHVQLPVRSTASKLVAFVVADLADIQVGVEHTHVILEHITAQFSANVQDTTPKGVAVVEGALGVVLALQSQTSAQSEVAATVSTWIASNRNRLALAAVHEAATIRLALAELIARDSLVEIAYEWMGPILDHQEVLWRVHETLFVAVGVHLKEHPTNGGAGTTKATIALLRCACKAVSDTFEVRRAVGQAVPLLAHEVVRHADPTMLKDFEPNTSVIRTMAWSTAISFRLATHRYSHEVNADLAASARYRTKRRAQLIKVPTQWARWVEEVAGADPVVATLFASYGIEMANTASSVVSSDTWNNTIQQSPRAVLDAITYSREATANKVLGATLDDVVANSWIPHLGDPKTPVHMQCILCDAIITVLVGSTNPFEKEGPAHPFPHLQHPDYKPPVLEDGGSDAADGIRWIIQALAASQEVISSLSSSVTSTAITTATLDMEKGDDIIPQVATSTTASPLHLLPETIKVIAGAVRKVVESAGTEPAVVGRIAHLAGLISMEGVVDEGIAFGATTFLRRLTKIFPKYKEGRPALSGGGGVDSFDDTDDDWDGSDSDEDLSCGLAAGISVDEEVQRVRRQMEYKGPRAVLASLAPSSPHHDELAWFVATD